MLSLLVSFALVAPRMACTVPATVLPQETAAERMLERATVAAAAIDKARFHAVFTIQLILAHQNWRAEGIVNLDRGRRRLRVDGDVRMPGEAQASSARLSADGAEWVFIDDVAGRWSAGGSYRIGGDASLLLAGLSLDAVTGVEPYAGEEAVGLSGPEGAGAEKYWVLETRSIGGTRTTTWYLSTRDLLPRQCDRRTPLDQGEELVERILHGTMEQPEDAAWAALERSANLAQVEAQREAPVMSSLVPRRERALTVTPLVGSIAPLREAFEAARGKRRVIGLFAPT